MTMTNIWYRSNMNAQETSHAGLWSDFMGISEKMISIDRSLALLLGGDLWLSIGSIYYSLGPLTPAYTYTPIHTHTHLYIHIHTYTYTYTYIVREIFLFSLLQDSYILPMILTHVKTPSGVFPALASGGIYYCHYNRQKMTYNYSGMTAQATFGDV